MVEIVVVRVWHSVIPLVVVTGDCHALAPQWGFCHCASILGCGGPWCRLHRPVFWPADSSLSARIPSWLWCEVVSSRG